MTGVQTCALPILARCLPPCPFPNPHGGLLPSSDPLLTPAHANSLAREALTKRMGGGVGRGLRRQDDELCGGVLGEGEDGGHGAGHGRREAGGQVLVQGRVPEAWGDKALRSGSAGQEAGLQAEGCQPQASNDHHARPGLLSCPMHPYLPSEH